MNKSNVYSPSHYNTGKIEVIDAIDDWNLGFYEGNIVKYVARAKHKGKQLEDLKKAHWYLERLINSLEQTFQEEYKNDTIIVRLNTGDLYDSNPK